MPDTTTRCTGSRKDRERPPIASCGFTRPITAIVDFVGLNRFGTDAQGTALVQRGRDGSAAPFRGKRKAIKGTTKLKEAAPGPFEAQYRATGAPKK